MPDRGEKTLVPTRDSCNDLVQKLEFTWPEIRA